MTDHSTAAQLVAALPAARRLAVALRADPDDVVQEAVARLLERHRAVPVRDVHAYLQVIIRNLVRARWRTPPREIPTDDVPEPPQPWALTSDRGEALVDALATAVPLADVELLVARYVRGDTTSEICAAHALTRGALYQRLARARARAALATLTALDGRRMSA